MFTININFALLYKNNKYFFKAPCNRFYTVSYDRTFGFKFINNIYMNEKKIILCHFGDQCGPGILINDILCIREKNLFQLAIYGFNDIIRYLKNWNLYDIYDINYLCTPNGEKLQVHPDISEKRYHGVQEIRHSIYNFLFNHNYHVSDDLYILNYHFNMETFNEKIKNFQTNISDEENFIYFINFSNNPDIPKVDQMVELLLQKRNNFKIILFTCSSERAEQINQNRHKEYYQVILLSISYESWWTKDLNGRYELYKEIYEKFYQMDPSIRSQFAPFEQTHFFKTLQNNPERT